MMCDHSFSNFDKEFRRDRFHSRLLPKNFSEQWESIKTIFFNNIFNLLSVSFSKPIPNQYLKYLTDKIKLLF